MKSYKQNNTTYARQTPEEYTAQFLKDFRQSEGLALLGADPSPNGQGLALLFDNSQVTGSSNAPDSRTKIPESLIPADNTPLTKRRWNQI